MKSIQGTEIAENYRPVELEGKPIWVPRPDRIPEFTFIEREDLVTKAMAAWVSIDGIGPLHFRLWGPPGCGKNCLVYHLARTMGRDLYIINGHQELGPEDIACSATMTSDQKVVYVGSPLLAAALFGGIAYFDELGKAPTSALDPLASLLDDRRTLTSVLAGLHIKAHREFLFCAALNDDEERGLGLPRYIDERTRPSIYVGPPSPPVMEQILRRHLPTNADRWLGTFKASCQDSISPREALKHLGFAYRLSLMDGNRNPTASEMEEYIEKAHEKKDR